LSEGAMARNWKAWTAAVRYACRSVVKRSRSKSLDAVKLGGVRRRGWLLGGGGDGEVVPEGQVGL
jgi:hypothetical protein